MTANGKVDQEAGERGAAVAAAHAFTAALRAVSGELAALPGTGMEMNRTAARIDLLGRRLHGLHWLRDREMGEYLAAAVAELTAAQGLPEDVRAESARRAIGWLEAALTDADEGVRAPAAPLRTELPPRDDARRD